MPVSRARGPHHARSGPTPAEPTRIVGAVLAHENPVRRSAHGNADVAVRRPRANGASGRLRCGQRDAGRRATSAFATITTPRSRSRAGSVERLTSTSAFCRVSRWPARRGPLLKGGVRSMSGAPRRARTQWRHRVVLHVGACSNCVPGAAPGHAQWRSAAARCRPSPRRGCSHRAALVAGRIARHA